MAYDRAGSAGCLEAGGHRSGKSCRHDWQLAGGLSVKALPLQAFPLRGEVPPFGVVFRLFRCVGTRHGPTAGNADRAVSVDFRRLPAVIQATATLPFWQASREVRMPGTAILAGFVPGSAILAGPGGRGDGTLPSRRGGSDRPWCLRAARLDPVHFMLVSATFSSL